MSEPQRQQEVQQEIERTRERLGETVEELAAKADVKARARDKAAEVKAKAAKVKAKAAKVKTTAQGKAAELPEPVQAARARAVDLSGRVNESHLVQRRWPLAVVAGVVVAGVVIVWRRRKA